MTKTIDTLTTDIKLLLEGASGWNSAVTHFFSEGLAELAANRFVRPDEVRSHLSPSMMGKPCDRQKWYMVNAPELSEPLDYQARGTFFFGDMIELFALSMAMASGHKVEHFQKQTDICGMPGSIDAIIDGHLVDVKSASQRGFDKFKYGKVKEDDPFGYISQLSSYLYGEQDNLSLVDKDKASFLAIRKDRFDIVLDTYDLTEELRGKEAEVENARRVVSAPNPPMRGFDGVPDGKSGNKKMNIECNYCPFRDPCWPEARKFLYSDGIRYLVEVNKLPRVEEIT